VTDLDKIFEQLKQKRDEARVQMHLASKEIQDEWDELEEKMDEFSKKAKQFAADAKLKETGSGMAKALGQVGQEIKAGYERVRKALKD